MFKGCRLQSRRTNLKRAIAFVFLVVLFDLSVQAQEDDVRQLMASFVTALQNLDWEAFRHCWVDNPVLYGPADSKRIDDSATFDAMWQMQFQQLRQSVAARGITSAPYVKVEPQGMRIDFPSPTVAVITFHLSDNNRLRRRMLVAAKTEMGWKITHLNNSDVVSR
jgi:hypothetical protein